MLSLEYWKGLPYRCPFKGQQGIVDWLYLAQVWWNYPGRPLRCRRSPKVIESIC